MEKFSAKQSFMCFQNVLFDLLFHDKNYIVLCWDFPLLLNNPWGYIIVVTTFNCKKFLNKMCHSNISCKLVVTFLTVQFTTHLWIISMFAQHPDSHFLFWLIASMTYIKRNCLHSPCFPCLFLSFFSVDMHRIC